MATAARGILMQKAVDTSDDDRLHPLASLNKNEWERLHLHHSTGFVVKCSCSAFSLTNAGAGPADKFLYSVHLKY